MVLGAYFFFAMSVQYHFSPIVSLIGVIVAMVVLGVAVNILIFYRLVGASLFTIVVATMGLSLLLQTIGLIIWGPNTQVLPTVFANRVYIQPFGVPMTTL